MDEKLNPCLMNYQNSEGYFSIFTIDQNKNDDEEFFNADQLEKANSYIEKNKNINCYYSISSFLEEHRNVYELDTIHLNFIDIDSHIFGLSEGQAIDVVEEIKNTFNVELPEPTSIIYTGRGLQMLFNLYGSVDVVKWELIQKGLYLKTLEIVSRLDTLIFPEMEVDRKLLTSPSKILRTTGTYNTEADKFTETIYHSGKLYTQKELLENYDLYIIERGQRKYLVDIAEIKSEDILNASQSRLRTYRNKNKFYTVETLNNARINDLIKLIKIRNKAGYFTGYRNMILNICCEIFRQRTSNVNEILEDLNRINDYFERPLKCSEVRSWANMKLAHPKPYYFKHSTIIEILQITPEEQEKLKVIHSKSLVDRQFYERHKESVKSKRNYRYSFIKEETAAARQMMIDQARAMRKAGYTMEAIAIELKVNKSTVSRWMKIENRENRVNQ